jgi:hypothetical protein
MVQVRPENCFSLTNLSVTHFAKVKFWRAKWKRQHPS